ncbi:hypothetical protein L208DRAFT_785578 [Tricholoma matsutake]|nr:hypothetical protein L208DRAFT_785578 [Tricholoma matsutake 945]
MLPSKTIPEVNRDNGKKPTRALKPKVKVTAAAPLKKKARAHSVEVEEIEDKDSARNIAARNNGISPGSSFEIPGTKGTGRKLKKSPIYHFYEIVTNGPDGTPGDDGDVHYRCLHGAHKVCTIKRSMRSNLNVLVNNLRVRVKLMYQLYCMLKDREEPPTPDEIAIASGKKQLDGHTEVEYLKKLEKVSENIKKAFEDQQAWAAGPWDQEKFEQHLAEWIVACYQPFDEVEKPEFVAMMNFTHHTGSPLKIPQCNAIKQHVMKMGKETIEGVREMFSV